MESECYARIIPLSKVLTDKVILDEFISSVFKVNNIVRETYQFIRAYFIHIFKNNLIQPEINRSLIKQVFSLISNRRESSKVTEQMELFFKNHYEKIVIKEEGQNLKEILNDEAVHIETNVNNHIKNCIDSYINKYINTKIKETKDEMTDENKKVIKTEINKEFKLVKKQIYTENRESDLYPELVSEIIDLYKKRKANITTPQNLLINMYKINCYLEINSKKMYSFLPSRNSLIPQYVSFSKTILGELLRRLKVSKDELGNRVDEIWREIESNIDIKVKDGFKLTSFKSDGIGCSLIYTCKGWGKRSKGKKKPNYEWIDNLEDKEQFQNKNIVGIDPNKGNLMYCYDGDKVIRYTQNERRKYTKKTRYKKIRNENENGLHVFSLDEENILSLEAEQEKLSKHNSKTMDLVKYLKYLEFKNKYVVEFNIVYQNKMYRKLRFNTKINRKRNEDLFVSNFRKTYGSPENTIVSFGDWEQSQGMSFGKEPTKGKSCRDMLKRAGYKVYLKDEYCTSKLCFKCHSETENFLTREDKRPWKKGEEIEVWGLLRCKNGNCCSVQQRDFNSASNIRNLTLNLIRGEEIPEKFKRKTFRPV